MNEPNFRALCAELVDELHAYKVANPQHDNELVTRARAELSQAAPEPPHWTEGVCSDGAAILRDGVMVPIEEIVAELNRLTALAQPAPEPLTYTERLRIMREGICYGYQAGHEATVEGMYADPGEVADEMATEILKEMAQPAPEPPHRTGEHQ